MPQEDNNKKLLELKKAMNDFNNELIASKNIMVKIEQKVKARKRE